MNQTKSIKLNSIYFFIFLLITAICYIFSLIEEINILANETLVQKIAFIIYVLFGFGLIYALIITSRIIELNKEEIIIYWFFKLGSTKKINIQKILKILQTQNKQGRLIIIELIFSGGEKIHLYSFQKNFYEVNTFLRENYPDEMFEVKQ